MGTTRTLIGTLPRRSVGEYRSHLGVGKDPEAEDRTPGRLEFARRVHFTRREIECATYRLLGYAVQSRDVDGPEARIYRERARR